MRNLYTPAVMEKIFDEADAAAIQSGVIQALERNALEVYCEFTTATSLKIVPWVRLKVMHNGEKADAWAACPEVTINRVSDTANPAGATVLGGASTRSAPTVISIPNCYEVRLELTTITGGGTVTVWAACIEKAPAIA